MPTTALISASPWRAPIKGDKKDKSSELNPSIKPEHATHYSDAHDYRLYHGLKHKEKKDSANAYSTSLDRVITDSYFSPKSNWRPPVLVRLSGVRSGKWFVKCRRKRCEVINSQVDDNILAGKSINRLGVAGIAQAETIVYITSVKLTEPPKKT